MSRKAKGNIMLLMASFFWGSTFVAQEVAAKSYHMGAFTYQSVRMFVGALVLIPLILLKTKASKRNGAYEKPDKKENKQLIIAGVICGAVLCIASCLQQLGIADPNTNSGKIGFLTAMYIVIVPILYVFFGNKISLKVIIAAVLGVIGMYLLSVGVDFSVSQGDLFGIACAVMFSVHILVVDHFAPKVDGVKLSCIQFFVCGCLAFIPMVIFEKPTITSIIECWWPILYAGVFSCGIAYTCQILGQQHTDPTIASLLMSLESVFSIISGVIILHYSLSVKEILGCVVMFIAIILSQLPSKSEKAKIASKKTE